MSTRSLIAILEPDGSTKGVYCHSDGYIEGVGYDLLEYYSEETRIRELVALGDLSVLDKEISPVNELAEPKRYRLDNKKGPVAHSFDTPHEGVTIAYCRDRGEDINFSGSYSTEDEFWNDRDSWAEFKYLWKDGKWFVGGRELAVLKEEMER